MSSGSHQLAIVATVLFVASCGLDPSAKNRCGTNADCNPGRVCIAGVCENNDSGPTGCGGRDFDCDGHNDLLWYEAATGKTQVWYMDGLRHLGDAALDVTEDLDPSNGWRLAGVGDFNRDGHPDVVAREGNSGVTAIWYMKGTSRTGVEALDPALNLPDDTGWSLVGVCDFNQDGWPDLLWHHGAYGATQLWYMHGATRGAYANLDGVAVSVTDDSGWQLAGTGDFNRDGKPDILWRGSANGEAKVWIMDGFTLRSSSTIAPVRNVSETMTLSETDDLDLDGSSDLVWWSSTTGTVDIWLMNGTSPTTQSAIDGAPDSPGWTIVPH
jgi:hypothetical protein